MSDSLDLNLEMARQMKQGFVSRGIASLVVARVAEFGESGRWPEDVTPETLGMALRRLMVNAPDEDAFASLERGYRAEKPPLNLEALRSG